MSALARDGAGRMGAAQVGLRRGRVGRMAGGAAPVGLGAGVGLWSTAEAVMATGEAAMLAAVQPAAAAADEPAGVVARALAGVLINARTVARLAAAW
jgi:hypothetical protein